RLDDQDPTGLHPEQAGRHVGQPRFYLATRPPLPQDNGTALIEAYDVERVLPDIDAHYGDRRADLLRHGVLLGFGAPSQLRLLAGQEHRRALPLSGIHPLERSPNRGNGRGCNASATAILRMAKHVPFAWAARLPRS